MKRVSIEQTTTSELVKDILVGFRKELQELTAFVQSRPLDNGKPHLTRKETAQFFDVSLNCINDWCKNGILTPNKVGQRVYFSKEECINVMFNKSKNC